MRKANDYAIRPFVNVTYGIFCVKNFGKNYDEIRELLLWFFEMKNEICC